MSTLKNKLAVAAVETTTTAMAAGAAVALVAGGPTAAALAAIPILAKTIVECLLDAPRAAEARTARANEFAEDIKLQLETVISTLATLSLHTKRVQWQSLSHEEVLILVEQLLDQAMKSPQRERRRMLAAAAAGTFRPDLTTESKSRATRAIDHLEPSDVAVLRRLVQVRDVADYRSEFDSALTDEQWISTATLLRVGCLAERPALEDRASNYGYGSSTQARPPRLRMLTEVTPLARAVLSLLDSYPSENVGPPKKKSGT